MAFRYYVKVVYYRVLLLPNGQQQFVCKNVYMIRQDVNRLKIPVAHGEGRYYADENVLDELEANNQVIFRYCDEKGI